MRVAAAADGVAPTARVPGVVAAAVASTANVSGALRGCLHEVRAARKKCRVPVLNIYRYLTGIYHFFDSLRDWYGNPKSGMVI